MNKRVLRSVAAIPLGGAAVGSSYFAIMFAISLFHREPFKPDVPFSPEWLLVNLLVGFVCSVIGGFVTGIVAQRREIMHATGLIVLTLLLSVCLPNEAEHAKSVPHWYVIAGNVLVVPATLLGGWLSRRQRTLLGKGPGGPIRAEDRVRLLMASIVAFGTFILVGCVTGAFATVGLGPLLDWLLGETHPATGMLPCFFAILLSAFSAWYVFREIAGERASPASGRATDDGKEG